ncbi:MAG: nucleolar RNA-binding Nop10p family protein [Candidatus Woesearchaeota archaeon]
MAKHILKCPKCGKYLLDERCYDCDLRSVEVKPPKYSPEDKYGKYRRAYKKQEEDSK